MSLKQGKKIKNSILYNYVPYAFHYNHQSILTKNGELIFVLKLENRFDDHFKEIIVKNFSLKSFAPYAIWITTINEEIKNENFFNNDNIQKNESLESKINQIFSSRMTKLIIIFTLTLCVLYVFSEVSTRERMLHIFTQKGADLIRLNSPRFPGLGINGNIYSYIIS